MYKFSYSVDGVYSKGAFSVKSLSDLAENILHVSGLVLSCRYFGNRNGKDIYCILNVFGGNEIVGYCSGNIS